MVTSNLNKYSGLALRTGIAIVLLWFGFSQIKNPGSWTRLMPEMVTSILPFSPTTLIYMNGTFEIIIAIILLLGFYTRIVSLIITLHLLDITYIVGYGPTGARDLALSIAALAIFLRGADEFCLDKLLESRKENKENPIKLENPILITKKVNPQK